jgi:hypothetical protein
VTAIGNRVSSGWRRFDLQGVEVPVVTVPCGVVATQSARARARFPITVRHPNRLLNAYVCVLSVRVPAGDLVQEQRAAGDLAGAGGSRVSRLDRWRHGPRSVSGRGMTAALGSSRRSASHVRQARRSVAKHGGSGPSAATPARPRPATDPAGRAPASAGSSATTWATSSPAIPTSAGAAGAGRTARAAAAAWSVMDRDGRASHRHPHHRRPAL